MKKLVAAIAVLTSGTVSAFDYRTDMSEGYKPNVETVANDRAVRDEKTYSGAEVELICTIDGVPGKQVTVRTEEWKWEGKEGKADVTLENKVTDVSYSDWMTMHMGGQTAQDYVRVDRITGEYYREWFMGKTSTWVNNVRNNTDFGKEITKGVCVPGKHKKQEAQF